MFSQAISQLLHRKLRFASLSLPSIVASLALGLAQPAPLQAQGGPEAPAKSSDEAVLAFSDAVNLQNSGKFGLAADEYTDFLKRYGSDPLAAKAYHYLGVCQFQSQKYEEAIAAVQKAAQLAGPKFELADEAYFFLGLANYRLGEQAKDDGAKKDYMTKAARALGTLATKFAKSKHVPLALFYNAEAQYAAGKKAEAVKAYQMLLDEHADSEKAPDALYGMGYALEELGQSAEAAAAYDKFLAKYSKHRLANDVSLRRGESLFAQKKYEEAAPLFGKVAAIEGFELADHALMQQAACYYEMKRYDDAAKAYLAIPEKFAQSSEAPLARLNAGRALMNVNRFADARNVLGGLLGSKQKDLAAEAAHLVARVALLDKKPGEAADVVAKAIAAAPGAKWEAQLLFDQADALYDQADKRKAAIDVYQAVAKRYPEEPLAADAEFMAAYTALQTEDSKRAAQLAADFLSRRKDHKLAPEAGAILAEASVLQNDPAAAEKQLQQLITAYPDHKDAGLWKRRLGYALLLADRPADAVAQLAPIAAGLKTGDAKDAEALADVQFWLSTAFFKQKAFDKAVAAAQASLAAAPQGRNADRALLILAESHAAANQFNEAIAAIERVPAQFANSPIAAEARYRLANYLARSGNAAKAVEKYQQLIDQSADSEFAPYAMQGIAMAKLDARDYAGAETVLTALLDRHGNSPIAVDARLDRATARQFLGKYREAADDAGAYLKAKANSDRASAAKHILGLCLDRLKQPEEAVKTFQAILKDDPKYAETAGVLYELGWSLRSLKRDAEARATFTRLATEFADTPLGPEAHYLLGDYYFADKAYDKAKAEYEAAAKKLPAGVVGERILHRLGATLFRMKQYDQAAAVFRRQLAHADKGELTAEGYFMLGESLFAQQKHADAFAAYQQAIERKLSSKDFEALALLHAGQSAAQGKKWNDSLTTLDRLVKSHPQSSYLPEALYEQGWAKRNLADEADAKGKQDAASKLYDEALELFDSTARKTARETGARARFMMGEIHFLRKNYREAERNYLKLAEGYRDATPETDRWKAKAAFSLGHVYTAMKQPDSAKKWFETTIERYPKSEEAAAARQRIAKLSGG